MPDAVAMLARCFEAQYRGLHEEERELLARKRAEREWLEAWGVDTVSLGPDRVDIVLQQTFPIWTAGPDGLHLISIKLDVPEATA